MTDTKHQSQKARTPRVPVEELVRRRTERNVAYYALRPDEIPARLSELDREWDIDRALEANASAVALGGALLGAVRSRFWFLLPVAVAGFLLQHAARGTCAPAEALRRLGVRTRAEIDSERYSLKALRGDFGSVQPAEKNGSSHRVLLALEAVKA